MSDSQNPEPKRFELREGHEVEIGNEVRVVLKSCMYAHLGQSRNLSRMQLDVIKDGQHQQITLEHLSPGETKYERVAGMRMAIGYVDAYHSPSTGALLVLP